MFTPSPYSASPFRTSGIALDNKAAPVSCEAHKALSKKYKKAMWKKNLLSKERQALEHKANAAHADYLACKEVGSSTELKKITTKATRTRSKSPKKITPSVPVVEAEAAAATAAAEAETAGGGNVPVVAFGLVALLVVGGGAYFLFAGNKPKKKKKRLPQEAPPRA